VAGGDPIALLASPPPDGQNHSRPAKVLQSANLGNSSFPRRPRVASIARQRLDRPLLALFLFAIHRQWPAGRWIGIAVICPLDGFVLIDAMSWMRTRGDLSQCVIEGIFGFWWAHAFAFSSKARRCFAPAGTRRPMARVPGEAAH